MAANTFRLGLPQDSKLPDSLIMRHPKSMHQLMRQIEKYKRLEDDRQQSKGKAPTSSQYAKDSRPGDFQPPRRELRIQEPNVRTKEINMAFKEPIHKIPERIKNEPYFRWLSKMGGDPARRNQNNAKHLRIIWSSW